MAITEQISTVSLNNKIGKTSQKHFVFYDAALPDVELILEDANKGYILIPIYKEEDFEFHL